MASFCLSQTQIAELKVEMKKVGGTKLAAMSFAELETFFSGVMGNEEVAVSMAKGFKLAVISKRKNALQNWLKKTLTADEVKTFNKVPDEKAKILAEYAARIKEIRAEYKAKKITNTERVAKEKIAKEVKERKERDPLTAEQKAQRNIARLQTRLEEIKAGKIRPTEKRELTPEENAIHAQIDAEMEKIAKEVTRVHEDIDTDVIERALGYSISAEEVETINRITAKMFEAEQKTPDNQFTGYHSDYFKAKNELNDYLDTINPMSMMDMITKVIFRGTLLAAPKSIITNVVGNVAGGIAEKTVETAIQRKLSGVNTDLIVPYINYAAQTYKDTGIDIVRAMDAGGSGANVLGEHFQGVGEGTGKVRAYARFIEQYVFRWGQGTPDIYFAALHLADNINILSTKIADAKGLTGEEHKAEARKLFLLATSLTMDQSDPKYAQAIQIKQTALQYALTATYQNQTAWSDTALKVRDAIDDYTGGLNLGTNLSPFVKTLVNVAKLSLDMSGASLPFELLRIPKAITTGDTDTIKQVTRVIVRAGFGMTFAMIIAAALDDDDYLPDYTIASDYQKEIAKLANAPYNSIRIGDKWVSLVYFGTLGYAIAGMLGARQAQGADGAALAYAKNAIMQLRQTPVIAQVVDMFDAVEEAKKYNKTPDEIMGEAIADTANFFSARIVPALVSDIAKGVDDKERYVEYGLPGIDDSLKAKIPFWRETLPPKYNGLGEEIPTEAFYWILLTGARVKTAPENTQVYGELTKLSQSGEEVSIKLTTFKDVKTAKEILTGREYNELTAELQRQLTNAYANIMDTQKYKNENDAEKKKRYLMDAREDVVKKVIRESGYKSRIRAEQKD